MRNAAFFLYFDDLDPFLGPETIQGRINILVLYEETEEVLNQQIYWLYNFVESFFGRDQKHAIIVHLKFSSL